MIIIMLGVTLKMTSATATGHRGIESNGMLSMVLIYDVFCRKELLLLSKGRIWANGCL